MKTKDEALRMALEALEYHTAQTRPISKTQQAITAIEEALAQPEQEPVGEVSGHDWSTGLLYKDLEPGTPLYTAPPKREWVGLTEKDAELVYEDVSGQSLRPQDYRLVLQFAVAIEAKLKELNNG
jgi:hypothetical protein